MQFRRTALVLLILAACSPLAAQGTSPQFRRLDRNNDGQLTRGEIPERLLERIDSDGDGVVTAEEDRRFLRRRAAQQDRPQGRQLPLRLPETVEAHLDVPYAGTDNPRQRLDLLLPKKPHGEGPLPVVAFVHGGGWQNGDKRAGLRAVLPLVESGEYAGVSIGYRLSGEATWPAQIHDCKAAVRYLRANAKRYHLDPDRIGVTGTSAGGHLVAVLGTGGGVADLEGELGPHRGVSSRVACVVDQFGPTDFLAMGGRHDDADSPESRLVGGPIRERRPEVQSASPITYVSEDDPPFLLIHGTDDPAVPFGQSELLHAALRKAGVESLLVPVTGGGHGTFGTPEVQERMRRFFEKHLLGRDVSVSDKPITAGARTGR
jgi:acetyl esterase/lipase